MCVVPTAWPLQCREPDTGLAFKTPSGNHGEGASIIAGCSLRIAKENAAEYTSSDDFILLLPTHSPNNSYFKWCSLTVSRFNFGGNVSRCFQHKRREKSGAIVPSGTLREKWFTADSQTNCHWTTDSSVMFSDEVAGCGGRKRTRSYSSTMLQQWCKLKFYCYHKVVTKIYTEFEQTFMIDSPHSTFFYIQSNGRYNTVFIESFLA